MSFLADTTITSEQNLIDKLKEAGWSYKKAYVSKPRDDHETQYVGVFTREIKHPKIPKSVKKIETEYKAKQQGKVDTCLQDFVTEKNSVTDVCQKSPVKPPLLNGVESDYGSPIVEVDPNVKPSCDLGRSTVSSPDLSDILSISLMRQDGRALVLALDTEFYYLSEDVRSILTWQIAFVAPNRPDYVQEIIFASTDGKRLSVSFLLSWVIEHYDLSALVSNGFGAFDYRETRHWVYHTVNEKGAVVAHDALSVAEAYEKSTLDGERAVLSLSMPPYREHKAKPNAETEDGRKYVDKGRIVDGYVNNFYEFNKYSLPVILLCHAGKADLTALRQKSSDDFMPRLSDVQGGLVALSDFYLHPPTIEKYWKFFPVNLTVRDTMCFAPAGQKSLAALGKTIGVPKLDVSDADKNNMLDYLKREPVNFFEYAINDSVITLCFAGELWGYNTQMPVTVSGAAVKAAVPVISEYLGIPADGSKNAREAYNRAFRGLHTVKKGLSIMPDKAGFLENTSLEPINDNARLLQTYAKQAYKGGYNGSIIIGKFDGEETHDYDLENAYPTCMSLIPDVDWSGDIIANEITHRKIRRQDFHTPFDLMFGYIRFKFPDTVKFPCIPVSVNGSMVFPRSSDGLDGVYASAPEIYLALCLGAEIWAEHVFVGEFRYNADGSVSRSLYAAVKQLVNDRTLAQKSFGKKSLLDLLLKIAVNSLYGKSAQDLIDKETWNAFLDRMDNIGGSAMTSPTHACLTTAGVRCVLLAAMNELDSLGYKTYSVTTDGFISNAPEDVLNSLGLFGFSDYFRSARQALVGSTEMWAEKHHQNDLLNFTTRGNVSLSEHGVCAHNSFVTGFDKDSYEDRLALMTVVLGRDGRCHCFNKTWTKFRRLASRQARADFAVTERGRALSMDFDLKRKPLKSSMQTVFPVVEGVQFEIANFDTVPYETVSEYHQYKTASKSCRCLRTEKDWLIFFAKAERTEKGGVRQLVDLDWSILFTCIMGYRLGLWDIPYLNSIGLSVKDKVSWVNQFNKSKKQFTESDWKNCRKQNRASQMLDRKLCEDTLAAMQSWGH